MENKIHQIYGVKAVRVVSAKENSKEQITSRLSEVSAYYLDSVVKEKMVVGISWGNTLYHIVKYIDANNKKNIPITVVPIMGASNVNARNEMPWIWQRIWLRHMGELISIFMLLFL